MSIYVHNLTRVFISFRVESYFRKYLKAAITLAIIAGEVHSSLCLSIG